MESLRAASRREHRRRLAARGGDRRRGGAGRLALLGSGGSWLKPASRRHSRSLRSLAGAVERSRTAAGHAGRGDRRTPAGRARLDAIDAGAPRAPAGATGLSGFVDSPPSHSQGSPFDFETGEGKVLVETSSPTDGLLPGRGFEVSGELGPSPTGWRPTSSGAASPWFCEPTGCGRTDSHGRRDRSDRPVAGERLRGAGGRGAGAGGGTLAGFVLGDDGDVDERTTEDFRNSGLSHLLAVSGQNVVLLALLAIPFLS